MCSPARAYLIRCMTAFIWFHLNRTGTTFMCSFTPGGSVTWAARVGEAAWYCLRSAGPETGETGEMCRSTRWSPAGDQVFLHRLAAPVRDYEDRESCRAPGSIQPICVKTSNESETAYLSQSTSYYVQFLEGNFTTSIWSGMNLVMKMRKKAEPCKMMQNFHLGWLSGTGINCIDFRLSKHIILLRQKDKCVEFPQSSH